MKLVGDCVDEMSSVTVTDSIFQTDNQENTRRGEEEDVLMEASDLGKPWSTTYAVQGTLYGVSKETIWERG